MKKIFLFILVSSFSTAQNIVTPYEKGNGNQTPTFQEIQAFYNTLDSSSPKIKIFNHGPADSGDKLRTIVYSSDSKFSKKDMEKKLVILVNNAIHPGEPDGVDASSMLLRDLVEGKISEPKNVMLVVIEAYNIGGMLNRGSYSRANQNGPEQYGFRGNAQNYDLNRDFIKTDSRNAQSFQELYHHYNPDIFIDNHVSNGADYQHTLTYIATSKDRLGKTLGNYYYQKMNPSILQDLKKKNIHAIPYVNVWGTSPDNGYDGFMDTPRYATGYTTLFGTIGTVPETHMLKPYKDRVHVTYENMLSYINYANNNAKEIKAIRKESQSELAPGKVYFLDYQIDRTKPEQIEFKGFYAGKKKSEVTGAMRLYYDRSKSYTKTIPFYNTFKPLKEIKIPRYYVIPQGQWKVIEHLKRNQIAMQELDKDSVLVVEEYRISDYKTSARPYEGHYLHYDTTVKSAMRQTSFRKGDYLVPTTQRGIKYILETLEPAAVDSFFNWNFFDSYLGQKEHFSDYVFEATAANLLKEDKALKTAFELEKVANKDLAKDPKKQLEWIYQNSKYFELSFLRYPIYRLP